MKITFLGTSAGTPTHERNVTSQAVQFDEGHTWLLDCGEGTQHQILRAGLKPSKIERILITHLHGDHCFGLPGMLASMAVHGRGERAVDVIGPPGVRELIEVTTRISATVFPFALNIIEVDKSGDLGMKSGWSVAVAPLKHRVPSFGYSLKEQDRPGRFDPALARKFHVPPGPLYKKLQEGLSVTNDQGELIDSRQVCGPPRPGRHIVLLGDTCDSDALAALAKGCDVLVHEVTYDEAREDKAKHWGHSTTAMAGQFARRIQAKTLIITHFSSRFDEQSSPNIQGLVRETEAHCPGTAVLAAEDMWSFDIPLPE